MEENDDIRSQYHARFEHVVVDECQDVNRASARLLRVLCGVETEAWVVADQRQSIYRFRGAEPSDVARFEKDFGGTKHSLNFNYRSHAPVVRAFEKFSSCMGDGKTMAGSWTAFRGDGGEVTLTVAPTVAAEAEAIKEKIEELRAKGVPYGDQIILARTHLTLARITGVLEKIGVPLLYLGDLFERSEIRDLLSLIGLDAEFGGIGLVRVAGLTEYGVSRDDSLKVIRWASDRKISIFDALKEVPTIDGLSASGRAGLERLSTHLQGMGFATSPWVLLTTWLFERSNYLRPLLAANDIVAQQKLVAIYHLLKVCGEHVALGDTSRRRFLERVRRIEALNEDTIYRAIASEATDMDAVRVMTIHGSKGLEFRAVHLPAIATRYMPTSRQGTRVPPPQSLAHLAMDSGDHDAEEESLFFVALSRARDYLSLSRAEKYTTQNSNESKFLPHLAAHVAKKRYQGSGAAYSPEVVLQQVEARSKYLEGDLDTYMKCPARYLYQVVQNLRGGRDNAAYVRFHGCVYKTVGWIEAQRQSGSPVSVTTAMKHLTIAWEANGPTEHAFEEYYRNIAESMVRGLAQAVQSETGCYERKEWSVEVGGHTICVTPDRVLVGTDGVVHVQRIRTGRKSKSEKAKPIYALLRQGARTLYPGSPVSIETLYLSTGEREPVPENGDSKSLQEYVKAIDEIKRGNFHPKPDPRSCPNCQCYFMCGN